MTTLRPSTDRLTEYRTKTEPVLGYYETRGILHRIDGDRSVEAVFARSPPQSRPRARDPMVRTAPITIHSRIPPAMAIPIKNSQEIEKMRIACRVASQVLERTGAIVQPGITTGEVDRAAAAFMREANAAAPSSITAASLAISASPSMRKSSTASAASGASSMETS